MLSSVAVVMRGTVLAQAVGILILPILARNFSPDAFGHFQIFQAILGLALVVATMRYEIAILRADGPEELGAVLGICFATNLTLTAIFSVGYLLYSAGTGWSFSDQFGFSFYYLIVGFLFGGFVQFWGYYLTREKLFGQSSNSKVVQALANATTALGIALTRPLNSGIVIADVAGRAAASAVMLALSFRRFRETVKWPSWADARSAASKFREYPLIAVPGGLVNMASAMLTPVMIYQSFDPATSGQFGLLERSATLPIALISISVSQVYMAHLAADLRTSDAEAAKRYVRLLATLASLVVPAAIPAVLFAPALFAFVFGPGWEQAATFAQLMAPAYCLSLLAGSINMTLIVLGWQKTQMVWEVARLTAMAALWIGGTKYGWSVEAMVAGHSALLTIFAAAMIILSYRAVRASEDQARIEGMLPLKPTTENIV